MAVLVAVALFGVSIFRSASFSFTVALAFFGIGFSDANSMPFTNAWVTGNFSLSLGNWAFLRRFRVAVGPLTAEFGSSDGTRLSGGGQLKVSFASTDAVLTNLEIMSFLASIPKICNFLYSIYPFKSAKPTFRTFYSVSASELILVGAFFGLSTLFGLKVVLSSISCWAIRVIFWLFMLLGYLIIIFRHSWGLSVRIRL